MTRPMRVEGESGPALRPNRWRRAAVVAAVGLLLGGSWYVWSGDEGPAREIRIALNSRDLAAARSKTDAWIRDRPGSPEARLWAARVALQARQDQPAADHYRQARALGAQADREIEGVLLARAGRFQEAEPLLRQALAGPREPRPLAAEALARLAIATFRFPAAKEALDRWERDAPTDPAVPLLRARAAELADADPTFRAAFYARALELDPANNEARMAMGTALLEAHQPRKSAEAFAEAIRREPHSARALAGAGMAAAALGSDEECRSFFQKALAEDPEQFDALKGLAQVELRSGRAGEAADLLERAIRLEPGDYDLIYNAVVALTRAGRADEAAARKAEADRLKAEGLEIRALRDAVLDDPADPDRLLAVVRWLIEHDHEGEGVPWVERALSVRPGHASSCQVLADHYERSGQPGLANFYRARMKAASSPP